MDRSKWMRIVSVLLACAVSPACGDDGDGGPDTEHGVVRVQVTSGAAGTDPFPDTASVIITFAYLDDCLGPFYEQTHPEYAKDGTVGADRFAEWEDRLCDTSEAFAQGIGLADCEVGEINQTLVPNRLSVTFLINDPDLSIKQFAMGPLPTEELAGCNPRIELAPGGVQGFDASGAQIWSLQSFSDNGRAATDQGAPLQVTVGP